MSKPICEHKRDCAFPMCSCGDSELFQLQDKYRKGIDEYFELIEESKRVHGAMKGKYIKGTYQKLKRYARERAAINRSLDSAISDILNFKNLAA